MESHNSMRNEAMINDFIVVQLLAAIIIFINICSLFPPMHLTIEEISALAHKAIDFSILRQIIVQ